MSVNLTWKPTPRQFQFLRSEARELLFSGAMGAGKTYALAMKIITRASHPGAVEGLVRKFANTLKPTTLQTVLNLLPANSIIHRKADHVIEIVGGGRIEYVGLDDEGDKIGSRNWSGCAVDQAEELDENRWTRLRGRIRVKADGLTNQLYAACNPAGPTHHLAQRFGLAGDCQPQPGTQAIRASTTDNAANLPADYVADLASWTGVAHARFYLGLWVSSEGLIYSTFDPSMMVAYRGGNWQRTIAALDVGFTNPCALLLIRQAEDGSIHVESEWYERQQTEAQIIAQCERWKDMFAPEVLVVDAAAAALIEALKRAGLSAIPAVKDVLYGIQTVSKHMVITEPPVPGPRFTVDPSCENLIKELMSYSWKPGDKDQPVKANDHACDALRYGLVHLAANSGEIGVALAFAGDDEDEVVGANLWGDADELPGWNTWR